MKNGHSSRRWLPAQLQLPEDFDEAPKSVGQSGLVPHELGHAAASLTIAAEANVKVVQSMLGAQVSDDDLGTLGAPLRG